MTAGLVAGSVVFVFLQLQPRLLFADTTPAGGDMGAHVWGPAYMRDELLPRWRLTGWTPDWYAGFPAYQFYMLIPSLLIVVLDVLLLLPYGVAFKLVTVMGLVSLPVAAWAMGRMVRLPFPAPAALAVATVPFIFDRSFSIYGGNAASTLAGEFSFSISLTFALLFLGVFILGLETGRHRGWAIVLFALTALCHVIPTIFAGLAALVALAVSIDWRSTIQGNLRRLSWAASTVAVGVLLSAFWTVPFFLSRGYMTHMGWEKATNYAELYFPGRIGRLWSDGPSTAAAVPGDMTWVIALALIGAGTAIVFRRRFGIFVLATAVVMMIAVVVCPEGRLWNARLLPFWYLCLYFLAALAVVELITAIAVLVANPDEPPLRAGVLGGVVVASLVTVAIVAFPLRVLPFGRTSADETTYSWLGFSSKDQSYVHSWARWNYSGYERKPAYPEYRDVIETMRRVGEEHGCGRAHYEYDGSQDRFGTPMALMLLPYWTNGCIGSMEGLYFESSATTPYHFLNAAELSPGASNPQRGLPYGQLNVARGIQHLQLLGVRYYMAFSDAAVAQADQVEDLRPVARTRTWTIPNSDGKTITWRIYQVKRSTLVQPLRSQPAVVTEWGSGNRAWEKLAVDWYLDPSRWGVALASDGPASWQRVLPDDRPARRAVPSTTVSRIRGDEDTISFRVAQTGVPILVKTSYFPNWKVSNADGPYRVAPNLMVVVPTGKDVTLQYGRTAVDWFGMWLTFLGIVFAVLLARRGQVPIPERVVPVRAASEPPPPEDDYELVTSGAPPPD